MRWIYTLLFVIALFLPKFGYAEELILPIPDFEANRMRGFNIGLSEKDPVTDLSNSNKNENKSDRSISINISSTLTELPVKNYWNLYLSEPHEIRGRTTYRGFESVINDQIRRIAMRFYGQYSDDYFDGLAQRHHFVEFNHRLDKFGLESSDFEYRWWNRSLSDSLVSNKGGSTTYNRIIGDNHEIIHVGLVGMDNTGRFSFDNYSIDVSTNADIKKKRTDLNSDIKNVALADDSDLSKRKLLFGVNFPLRQLLKTDSYVISGNAKINIRVDQFSTENKTGVSGYVRFTALHKRNPWLDIQVKGTARPLTNEYAAELSIQLVAF